MNQFLIESIYIHRIKIYIYIYINYRVFVLFLYLLCHNNNPNVSNQIIYHGFLGIELHIVHVAYYYDLICTCSYYDGTVQKVSASLTAD